MATKDGTGKLGPGTLRIGQTGTLLDVSCFVNNAVISPNKDEGDSTTKLCGTVKTGAITYAWTISGNVDVDAGKSSGLFALSWQHKGEEVEYEFTPSSAMGTTSKGTLIIDPLDFGSSGEYGDDLTSDFEWSITSDPTEEANITWGDAGIIAITAVTAGSPGSFSPTNATPPTGLDALKAHPVIGDSGTNKPTDAWTVGQYVVLGDDSHAYWDGTAWASGDAPDGE